MPPVIVGASLTAVMEKLTLAAALVCLCGTAVADPSRLVRGVVTRGSSTTPVAGATVLTDRGEIAVSDIDGYFAISVAPADRELTVAANGFLTRTVGLMLGATAKPVEWRVRLQPCEGDALAAAFSVRAIPLKKSGVGGLCWLVRPAT